MDYELLPADNAKFCLQLKLLPNTILTVLFKLSYFVLKLFKKTFSFFLFPVIGRFQKSIPNQMDLQCFCSTGKPSTRTTKFIITIICYSSTAPQTFHLFLNSLIPIVSIRLFKYSFSLCRFMCRFRQSASLLLALSPTTWF